MAQLSFVDSRHQDGGALFWQRLDIKPDISRHALQKRALGFQRSGVESLMEPKEKKKAAEFLMPFCYEHHKWHSLRPSEPQQGPKRWSKQQTNTRSVFLKKQASLRGYRWTPVSANLWACARRRVAWWWMSSRARGAHRLNRCRGPGI